MKALAELDEREILALAIANEEEDSRIYQSFADRLRPDFAASAGLFDDMAEEEREHRNSLYELYRTRFGEHLPPIRREDVRGFLKRRPIWWSPHLDLDKMRREAEIMELQAANFYDKAALQTLDVGARELFTKLAEVERGHEKKASEFHDAHLSENAEVAEEAMRKRLFVLQYVQPGLAGLIDGSVSTLAPLFAAAFATQNNWETFLVGLAASVGAGISMGFTEALSDNGEITGRGSPFWRGVICGVMTAIGGLGHTIPYLVPDSWPNAFHIATSIAALVVAIELVVISWIRSRYMDTPFLRASFQVIVGGVLVLLAGIFIGSA
ncbi:iron exporter MbfA [Microvirga sp. 2MCAF38]|uniref:iron exporter MbfA n=1 Tax=Microvirga sp. 2MCAF38 TaxID=3232989 RepID=UPI003F967EB5